VNGALIRYRIIAWVVGTGLLIRVFVGVPLQYAAGDKSVVAVVGPIHGFLYIVYLLATAELGFRARWSPVKLILVCLAGTIPFLSFVAERKVTRHAREQGDVAVDAGGPRQPG
jgi:integral membrane protein